MAEYVWHHDLKGEADRLRLMSDLLDPSSEFHLLRILRTGVSTGWRCLEIGAGNGSLSQWLAQRIGPDGHVIASDIRTDLMDGIAGGNLEVRQFDVVHDEPPDAPYDLIAVRTLLHHLPERRAVVSKIVRLPGWARAPRQSAERGFRRGTPPGAPDRAARRRDRARLPCGPRTRHRSSARTTSSHAKA